MALAKGGELRAGEHRAIERHRQHLSRVHERPVSFEEACRDWEAHHAVAWREQRQAEYLEHQRAEISKHKWIESQKADRDLGGEAVLDWIRNHAAAWRTWYEDHRQDD